MELSSTTAATGKGKKMNVNQLSKSELLELIQSINVNMLEAMLEDDCDRVKQLETELDNCYELLCSAFPDG